jgi:hypothetical protein
MNVKSLAGLVGSPCFIPFSMAHAAVSPKELVTEYHEPACMRFINSISGMPYAFRFRDTSFIFVDVKAVLSTLERGRADQGSSRVNTPKSPYLRGIFRTLCVITSLSPALFIVKHMAALGQVGEALGFQR